METMGKHRILLAHDHKILREGLRSLFASESDLDVAGEAENGCEAVRLTEELRPSLVLIDINLPIINGLEVTRAIKRFNSEVKVIAHTDQKTDECIRAMFEAGADGYSLKDDSYADLLIAIRYVLRGNLFMSAEICRSVINGYVTLAKSLAPLSRVDSLTNREREILQLIAEGYKNKEIAEHLFISVKTIEKHRANLTRKLDLHGGPALTKYAVEHGLVSG
jgi:DNA-binding NarL/FixJ family response regulator